MATVIRGKRDAIVDEIHQALEAYESEHSGAHAELYRQNSASVRIKVTDPRFEDMTRAERHNDVWDFLRDRVNADSMTEVTMLVLPPEEGLPILSTEFDNPLPSSF